MVVGWTSQARRSSSISSQPVKVIDATWVGPCTEVLLKVTVSWKECEFFSLVTLFHQARNFFGKNNLEKNYDLQKIILESTL